MIDLFTTLWMITCMNKLIDLTLDSMFEKNHNDRGEHIHRLDDPCSSPNITPKFETINGNIDFSEITKYTIKNRINSDNGCCRFCDTVLTFYNRNKNIELPFSFTTSDIIKIDIVTIYETLSYGERYILNICDNCLENLYLTLSHEQLTSSIIK